MTSFTRLALPLVFIMFCPGSSWALWHPHDLKISKTERIIIRPDSKIPQGIALFKGVHKGKSFYMAASFTGNETVKKAVLPREIFERFYGRFYRYFDSQRDNNPSGLYCQRKLSMMRSTDGRKPATAETCWDLQSQQDAAIFNDWYAELRKLNL